LRYGSYFIAGCFAASACDGVVSEIDRAYLEEYVMPTWKELTAELSQISEQDEYKSVQPLLRTVQQMVSAQVKTPEIMRGVLNRVKQLQAEARKGANLQELAEQTTERYIQPDWTIEGDVEQSVVKQSNQLFINVITINREHLKQVSPAAPAFQVPVVLLVMTATEAQQLANGKAFTQYPDPIYDQQFNRLLVDPQLTGWEKSYGNIPQDWKPFINNPQTITKVINEALSYIEGYQKTLVAQFIDIHAYNTPTHSMRLKLKKLREGCIVIMDDISIRHPVIQQAYRRSLLDAYSNVHIIRIAPTANALAIVQQMISFTEQMIDLEFYKRLTIDIGDDNCDEVSDNTRLTTWLATHIQKLLPSDEKDQGPIRKHMYKEGS
jgi:hypothetical protein